MFDGGKGSVKVLSRRSLSKVPRLRDWYSKRARMVSMGSLNLGIGCGGGMVDGVSVADMCSGVWGTGHLSGCILGGPSHELECGTLRRRVLDH